MLLLCLTATLAGAEHVTEIALFGETRIALLRRLRPFANGTPRHDHLGDILATLDAEPFQRCFAAWVASRTGLPEGVIAIDGKTSRRTRGKGKAALHLVSAFAARQRLVLGQARVADKSNEIVAIPKLLDLLQIEGAIVTIDAMGCQREIARKIVDKKADYILALKGNQGSLREDAELFADEQIARDFADTAVTRVQTIDGEHGRIETRTVTVLHDVDWLHQRHDWPGLTALAMVESVRETAEKTEQERRFYITSSALTAECLAPAIRDHWSIENSLHWVMDMVFRDDESRVRNGNAPANLAAIRHMAQNLIRARKGKLSVKANRKAAAWDDNHLIGLLIA
jgi:predicted transposase YbfD/YdcC